MHQPARIQEIPPNDNISRFAYDTPPSFAFNSEKIIMIWYGSIIFELSEIVVERKKKGGSWVPIVVL